MTLQPLLDVQAVSKTYHRSGQPGSQSTHLALDAVDCRLNKGESWCWSARPGRARVCCHPYFLGPASRDFLLEALGKMSMKIGLQYLYKLA